MVEETFLLCLGNIFNHFLLEDLKTKTEMSQWIISKSKDQNEIEQLFLVRLALHRRELLPAEREVPGQVGDTGHVCAMGKHAS